MSGDNREVFELAAQGLRLVNRADEVAAQMGVVERNHQAQMTQFRQELETLKRQEAEIRARFTITSPRTATTATAFWHDTPAMRGSNGEPHGTPTAAAPTPTTTTRWLWACEFEVATDD